MQILQGKHFFSSIVACVDEIGYSAVSMIWFYTRDQQSLTLETRYDNVTSEYVALVVNANGQAETRRFNALNEFRAWLVKFEQSLNAERWRSNGPPHFLAEGWPDKTP